MLIFINSKQIMDLNIIIKKILSEVSSGSERSYVSPRLNEWVELDTIPLNEDLAVWFGKKKKPKGSSQPKGPWVNICSKVDGKHPPCGRQDTSKGSYPKCRAAGVAGKMSDSEKKSACQQKRSAEKKDTQTGKGQKPVMTHYEPKKKKTQNESLDILVKRILDSMNNSSCSCLSFALYTNSASLRTCVLAFSIRSMYFDK